MVIGQLRGCMIEQRYVIKRSLSGLFRHLGLWRLSVRCPSRAGFRTSSLRKNLETEPLFSQVRSMILAMDRALVPSIGRGLRRD